MQYHNSTAIAPLSSPPISSSGGRAADIQRRDKLLNSSEYVELIGSASPFDPCVHEDPLASEQLELGAFYFLKTSKTSFKRVGRKEILKCKGFKKSGPIIVSRRRGENSVLRFRFRGVEGCSLQLQRYSSDPPFQHMMITTLAVLRAQPGEQVPPTPPGQQPTIEGPAATSAYEDREWDEDGFYRVYVLHITKKAQTIEPSESRDTSGSPRHVPSSDDASRGRRGTRVPRKRGAGPCSPVTSPTTTGSKRTGSAMAGVQPLGSMSPCSVLASRLAEMGLGTGTPPELSLDRSAGVADTSSAALSVERLVAAADIPTLIDARSRGDHQSFLRLATPKLAEALLLGQFSKATVIVAYAGDALAALEPRGMPSQTGIGTGNSTAPSSAAPGPASLPALSLAVSGGVGTSGGIKTEPVTASARTVGHFDPSGATSSMPGVGLSAMGAPHQPIAPLLMTYYRLRVAFLRAYLCVSITSTAFFHGVPLVQLSMREATTSPVSHTISKMVDSLVMLVQVPNPDEVQLAARPLGLALAALLSSIVGHHNSTEACIQNILSPPVMTSLSNSPTAPFIDLLVGAAMLSSRKHAVTEAGRYLTRAASAPSPLTLDPLDIAMIGADLGYLVAGYSPTPMAPPTEGSLFKAIAHFYQALSCYCLGNKSEMHSHVTTLEQLYESVREPHAEHQVHLTLAVLPRLLMYTEYNVAYDSIYEMFSQLHALFIPAKHLSILPLTPIFTAILTFLYYRMKNTDHFSQYYCATRDVLWAVLMERHETSFHDQGATIPILLVPVLVTFLGLYFDLLYTGSAVMFGLDTDHAASDLRNWLDLMYALVRRDSSPPRVLVRKLEDVELMIISCVEGTSSTKIDAETIRDALSSKKRRSMRTTRGDRVRDACGGSSSDEGSADACGGLDFTFGSDGMASSSNVGVSSSLLRDGDGLPNSSLVDAGWQDTADHAGASLPPMEPGNSLMTLPLAVAVTAPIRETASTSFANVPPFSEEAGLGPCTGDTDTLPFGDHREAGDRLVGDDDPELYGWGHFD